ncbi:alpha/beta hydrolase family protein [Isoptericola sediminis]|uniref:Alpha/beta fold hydrolase n=1 Tax=Isoptericola sediminis TaxID=2733572 RepID=A0A849K2X2_9MICO|nr:alpha/beta fold hydrolase [Isoptericola sediminis]NNU26399.1 alpha/beta fold hydrolase [Isoptericola sediminis]
MPTITSTPSELSVSFSVYEKVAGLVRDISVPWAAVAAVSVERDGMRAARGIRAPGLGVPGLRKVGTWRRREGGRMRRTVVSVRRGQPALRIELRGARWDEFLLGHEGARTVADTLASRGVTTESSPPTAIREHDVRFTSEGATLAGTVCRPDSPARAAVLLLPGSGPLDREGSHPRLQVDVSRQLAHALAARGVASLRYDKRGVGASPGDWRAAGVSDLVADARAARALLASQPGVDPARVVVLGHSEGALLAAAVAAGDTHLAGVVLLAGAARPGEEVLVQQAERLRDGLPAVLRAVMRLLRIDLVDRVRGNHRRLKATTADVARVNGARVNARWVREYMAHDPVEDIRRITAPVLAITGEKDLQVSSDDLDVVRSTAPAEVTVHRIPDLSHTLRRQPGTPSLRLYREEVRRPVDPEVVGIVTEWVVRHTAA